MTCGGQGGQSRVQAGGAHAAHSTQFGERNRVVGITECGGDALVDGAMWRRWLDMSLDYLEGERVDALRELERERRD